MKNKKSLRRKNYKKLSKKNNKTLRGGSSLSLAGNGAILISNKALKDAISDLKETEVPDYFLCPITHDIMKDPVICIDGFTYERTAIEHWLENNQTSPITRQSLVLQPVEQPEPEETERERRQREFEEARIDRIARNEEILRNQRNQQRQTVRAQNAV